MWHRQINVSRTIKSLNRSSEINSRVIKYDSHNLVPYRGVEEFSEPSTLYAELRSHELCWTDAPKATRSEFTHLIQRHWERFAEHSRHSDEVYVLEAVFFQHQIHDLLGRYQAGDRQIEQHIYGIAEQIVTMNPVLIYLTQPSVREQQVWISSVRAKPHFATEENITFMENRKRIEMMLADKISFPTYIIEIYQRMGAPHQWAAVSQLTRNSFNSMPKRNNLGFCLVRRNVATGRI